MLSFSSPDSFYLHLPRSHTSVLMHLHLFPVFFNFFFLYCFLPCCYYFFCCFLTYQNIFLHFFYLLFLHTICQIFGFAIAAETRTPASKAAGGAYTFGYFHYTAFLWQSAGIACITIVSSLYIRIDAAICTSIPQPNIPIINIMFSANIPRLNARYIKIQSATTCRHNLLISRRLTSLSSSLSVNIITVKIPHTQGYVACNTNRS